jgi:hypothetical protein
MGGCLGGEKAAGVGRRGRGRGWPGRGQHCPPRILRAARQTRQRLRKGAHCGLPGGLSSLVRGPPRPATGR